MIEQLIELLDDLDLNASVVKRKIDDEFERFSRFASDVLGVTDKQKAQKINQRKYVEYLLRNGTMEEKRQLTTYGVTIGHASNVAGAAAKNPN